MSWDIPQPYPVKPVPPPRWALWWQTGSLCCFLLLLAGAGLWFWLHDRRVLLWTLAGVVSCMVLFALLAGWLLFRSGVDAEGLKAYNRLQEHEWQRWAQQSLPVVGWHTVFAPEVLTPEQHAGTVNRDTPLTLPVFPGYSWLAEEIIMALQQELRTVIHRWPLEIILPEEAGNTQWRQFVACWEQQGLPTNRLTAPVYGIPAYDVAMQQWLEVPVTDRARLVIVKYWTGSGKYTEGIVTLLLAPQGGENHLPVRCSLHRPMSAISGEELAAFRQFLHYQTLTASMDGLWTDQKSKPLATQLLIAHSQRLKDDSNHTSVRDEKNAPAGLPAPLPGQYWLPHWLGHAEPCADWFTVALMMAMAEYRGGVQCGLFAVRSSGLSSSSWILSSISAGAFVND
ncbi:hypothetical protein ACGVWS_04115 [Enterobacteriaceae bacterium LUAb1]